MGGGKVNPGVHYDLPSDRYHASPGISHSILRRIEPTPAHLKAFLDSKEAEEPTADQIIGTLAHHVALQPEVPLPLISLQPDTYEADGEAKPWNYNAKVCKQWREKQRNDGRIILKKTEFETVLGCSRAVCHHPQSYRLFREGRSEVSVAAPFRMGGRSCLRRIRLDWLPPGNALVDVKTTQDGCAGPAEFSKRLYEFGYFSQAAYYLDVWNDLEFHPNRPDDWERKEVFLFIVVEKSPPFAVAVYQLSENAIEAGRRVNHDRLMRLMECQETGIWPSYPESITPIDLPSFVYRKQVPNESAA